ncbi:hypothetical protein [Streptomyces sp. SudanB182_2057]|uniref:hypothetical protein n=1 Tax=Streptomyces sp. SudanB182_2057 TaxID=3035281 RepID=UPI003F5697B6
MAARPVRERVEVERVVQEEPGGTGDGGPEDDFSAPLSRRAQIGAGVVGVLLTGGGGVAVFVADNQAGTVALILAGAIFLLMMFGGSPLHSLGFGEANLRFARRRAAVVNEAIDSPPDQAPRVLRDLEAVNTPGRPDRTVNALSERVYEDAVAHFLASNFPGYRTIREKPVRPGRRVDFAVESPSGAALVLETRYYRSGNPVGPQMIDMAAGYHTVTGSPVLLVSNSPLSRTGAEHLHALREGGADVHHVQWVPDGDDEPFRNMVRRLAP